jgi:hypothetical protein
MFPGMGAGGVQAALSVIEEMYKRAAGTSIGDSEPTARSLRITPCPPEVSWSLACCGAWPGRRRKRGPGTCG